MNTVKAAPPTAEACKPETTTEWLTRLDLEDFNEFVAL